jgi:zinc protease
MIHSEVVEIVTHGPRADDLQKVKENMLKKYTEDVAENGWWSGALERYYMDKINMVDDYKASVEAITAEKIQATLKDIVSQGNVLEVVMKPAE